jgi:sterol desaturase/sphingolipid hydroxylase (fatty acid hydroxylase superfamily)
MLAEAFAVAKVAGETMFKLIPISIAFGIVFGALTHWSACNPGRPWWRKREIVTDICYWFLIPLAARFVRIGFMVMGAAYFYGIHGAEALISFYDDGFGPLAKMPLWAQALTFLIVSDFLTYWIHRGFHGAGLWKYHSVHHSSEELDWISAARFHPVNIFFGTVLVDRAYCLPAFHPMSCCGSAPSRPRLPHSCTPI